MVSYWANQISHTFMPPTFLFLMVKTAGLYLVPIKSYSKNREVPSILKQIVVLNASWKILIECIFSRLLTVSSQLQSFINHKIIHVTGNWLFLIHHCHNGSLHNVVSSTYQMMQSIKTLIILIKKSKTVFS